MAEKPKDVFAISEIAQYVKDLIDNSRPIDPLRQFRETITPEQLIILERVEAIIEPLKSQVRLLETPCFMRRPNTKTIKGLSIALKTPGKCLVINHASGELESIDLPLQMAPKDSLAKLFRQINRPNILRALEKNVKTFNAASHF